MALLLRMKTITRSPTLTNPSLLHHHLFSTSNSDGDGGEQSPPDFNSPFASLFKDVKSSLKHKPSSPSPSKSNPSSSSFSSPASSNSQNTSIEEIMKNLSEFRRRTSVPTPDDPSSSQQISFQEIYKRNVAQKPGESAGPVPGKPGRQIPLDNIRESLRQMRDQTGADRMSSSVFMGSLRSKPSDSEVIGGMSALPETVFGKEMRKRKEGDGSSSAAMNMDFLWTYGHQELGEKLRKLRPVGKGKEWFSLGELSDRLLRLREMEEKKAMSNPTGAATKVLRDAISQMGENKDDKSKKTSPQRMDMLGLLGGTPTYLMRPPKEQLVEKFFHPDNMSSAEKLKIELTKVRDEFKMSESDCGSARVQVAQLTTKIKHLSSVLHKKDVHSRKGLLAMVQRRKRLLKYLRRTDWDSYCFVISKLGLRDNPDHSYRGRSGVMTN